LPSEAEWEYACRANTKTPFHFGETISCYVANYYGQFWDEDLRSLGFYGDDLPGERYQQTTDVMSYYANTWGLYDMHGNVWEWCADHWHDNYQNAPTNGSAWLTNEKEANRLLRGGSWYSFPRDCQSSLRFFRAPADRYYDVGFRVVCRLPA
jgi:formylglycine-generating enzyme required for sulfatase activity